MSLAEGLLLDGLYDPPIVGQDVFIARRSDSSPGTGTAENPYRGNTAAEFDAVMRSVCKNSAVQSVQTTIRIGPGDFETNGAGNTWPNPTTGFFLNSNVRLTGAGKDITKIKLATTGVNAFAGPASTALQGVEIDNLCVSCERKGGAINMTGEHLLVRDLRVVQWGPNSAVTDRVIVQIADSAAGRIAKNCILERVIFDDSGDYAASSSVVLVKLAGASQTAAHQFCVVRQCSFNGEPIMPPGSPPVVYPVTAINPGLGRGFIAEENQMFKVTTGIKLTNVAAIDLIFWNNEMSVVQYGIDLAHNAVGAAAIGRVVMIENAINLARISGTDCTGIRVLGDPSEENFKDVIVRKNIIAPDPTSTETTADLFGISVTSTTNAVIENNVMDRCDAVPLHYAYCTKIKTFNNQKPDGTLLRALDIVTGRYLMELQDFTEDALLGF